MPLGATGKIEILLRIGMSSDSVLLKYYFVVYHVLTLKALISLAKDYGLTTLSDSERASRAAKQ